jgi:hypothetical protein
MMDLFGNVADYLRSIGMSVPEGWRCYSLDCQRESGVPEGMTKVAGDVPIGKRADGRPKYRAKKYGTFYLIKWPEFIAWEKQAKGGL